MQNSWSNAFIFLTDSFSGFLARTSRSCNTSKTVLPGSWRESENANTQRPFCAHCTGSLAQRGSIGKSCCSVRDESLDMHLQIYKSLSLHKPPPAPSNPVAPPDSPPRGTGHSAQPHQVCATASPPSWGTNGIWTLFKLPWKLYFGRLLSGKGKWEETCWPLFAASLSLSSG